MSNPVYYAVGDDEETARLRRELAICTKRKDELEKELSASKDALVELEGRTNARNEALLEADQIKLELSGDITAYEAKLGDLLLEARLQSQARSEALRQKWKLTKEVGDLKKRLEQYQRSPQTFSSSDTDRQERIATLEERLNNEASNSSRLRAELEGSRRDSQALRDEVAQLQANARQAQATNPEASHLTMAMVRQHDSEISDYLRQINDYQAEVSDLKTQLTRVQNTVSCRMNLAVTLERQRAEESLLSAREEVSRSQQQAARANEEANRSRETARQSEEAGRNAEMESRLTSDEVTRLSSRAVEAENQNRDLMVRLQALETEQSESRMAETQRSIGHEQEMHALMQQMESDQETARELMSINNSLKTQIEELRALPNELSDTRREARNLTDDNSELRYRLESAERRAIEAQRDAASEARSRENAERSLAAAKDDHAKLLDRIRRMESELDGASSVLRDTRAALDAEQGPTAVQAARNATFEAERIARESNAKADTAQREADAAMTALQHARENITSLEQRIADKERARQAEQELRLEAEGARNAALRQVQETEAMADEAVATSKRAEAAMQDEARLRRESESSLAQSKVAREADRNRPSHAELHRLSLHAQELDEANEVLRREMAEWQRGFESETRGRIVAEEDKARLQNELETANNNLAHLKQLTHNQLVNQSDAQAQAEEEANKSILQWQQRFDSEARARTEAVVVVRELTLKLQETQTDLESTKSEVGRLEEFAQQRDLEVETTIGDLRAKTKMYEESLNKVSAERHVEAAQKSELEVANRRLELELREVRKTTSSQVAGLQNNLQQERQSREEAQTALASQTDRINNNTKVRRLEDELRILTEIRRNFDAEKRDLETKLHDTEATCRAMQAANQDLDQRLHQSIDMARQQEENLSRAELNSTRLNDKLQRMERDMSDERNARSRIEHANSLLTLSRRSPSPQEERQRTRVFSPRASTKQPQATRSSAAAIAPLTPQRKKPTAAAGVSETLRKTAASLRRTNTANPDTDNGPLAKSALSAHPSRNSTRDRDPHRPVRHTPSATQPFTASFASENLEHELRALKQRLDTELQGSSIRPNK